MTIILSNNDRAAALFEEILSGSQITPEKHALIIVQHILPNTAPFFRALKSFFHIAAIIPKPNSIHEPTRGVLENEKFRITDYSRGQLKSRETLSRLKRFAGARKLIVMDVGGYFAEVIPQFSELLGDRLIGIVEDTENGQQKYEAFLRSHTPSPCPILSVARSPLKDPEDYLVGQSIVYSAERILRENNSLLTNKRVLVIGYGKIGKSIASSLAVRNIAVWVYDHDPIRRAQALAHGFMTPERDPAIASADLIFGATGNKSLKESDFLRLKKYCFIASVTSADDEFDFGNLRQTLSNRFADGLEIFHNDDDRVFYVMNKGNAVNFAHNAVLGPYIYLVACELLACAMKLIAQSGTLSSDGIHTLLETERAVVASKWHTAFAGGDIENVADPGTR
jgi:adenosylhomocysteinase